MFKWRNQEILKLSFYGHLYRFSWFTITKVEQLFFKKIFKQPKTYAESLLITVYYIPGTMVQTPSIFQHFGQAPTGSQFV